MSKENKIELPRITKDGKPRISYSQVSLWIDTNSFNMGTDGWIEYICNYFLGFNWKDKGWGEFGHDVEDYVTLKNNGHLFTDKEKFVMDKIEPLGVFQSEIDVDFGDFVLRVIIDDMVEDKQMIRDYKTASESSSNKYKKPSYLQMDTYALAIWKLTGFLPEAEVCVIERKGNCSFSGLRSDLSVGDNIWYIPINITLEKVESMERIIRKSVNEISDHFKIFKKIN